MSAKNKGGWHYAFKGDALWIKMKPRLMGITGKGKIKALVDALEKGTKKSNPLGAVEILGGKAATSLKVGGRVMVVVGVTVSVYEIYQAEDKGREIARQLGGWGASGALAIAGAKTFALAGTFFGPVGTVVGGVIGGVGGAALGYFIGTEVTTRIYDAIDYGFADLMATP